MSKVPNCKDLKVKLKDAPGPGYYEKQNTSLQNASHLGGTAHDHKKSLSDVNSLSNLKGGPTNNFMSTTKRDDFWKNKIETPYTRATNEENPGPGKYNIGK